MDEFELCEYQEDKVINNVLCFLADGKWIEYSKEGLTEMLLMEQNAFGAYVDRVIDQECQ